MVEANSGNDQFDINWSGFKAHFEKLQIGVFENRNEMDGRSRLDDLLDAVNLPYSDYCIYSEATKVNKLPGYYKSLGLIQEAIGTEVRLPFADRGRHHHTADGRAQNN